MQNSAIVPCLLSPCKKTLRFLYDNYDSSCKSILKLAGNGTMNITSLRSPWNETFKTLNNVNPAFMNQIFELRKAPRAAPNQY